MAADSNGLSNFTPPTDALTIETAANYAAFHFNIMAKHAKECLLAAVLHGGLKVARNGNHVEHGEIARWHGRGSDIWDAAHRRIALEALSVTWADVRTALVGSFFEPGTAPPWPVDGVPDEIAGFIAAFELAQQYPEFAKLPQSSVDRLAMLAVALNYVAVGTVEGGQVRPVELAQDEKYCIQQGTAESRQDLIWAVRAAKGDPNCQPPRSGLLGQPPVCSLLVRRWRDGAHGPVAMPEEALCAIRAIENPLVYVPGLIGGIVELTRHPERLRRMQLDLPRGFGTGSTLGLQPEIGTAEAGAGSSTPSVGGTTRDRPKASKEEHRIAFEDYKNRLRQAGQMAPIYNERRTAIGNDLRQKGLTLDRDIFKELNREHFANVRPIGRPPKENRAS